MEEKEIIITPEINQVMSTEEQPNPVLTIVEDIGPTIYIGTSY